MRQTVLPGDVHQGGVRSEDQKQVSHRGRPSRQQRSHVRRGRRTGSCPRCSHIHLLGTAGGSSHTRQCLTVRDRHRSRDAGQGTQVRGRGSWDKGQRSQVSSHKSMVSGQRSEVRGRRSDVTGHRSRVTCQGSGQVSHVRGRRLLVRGHRLQSIGRRSEVTG